MNCRNCGQPLGPNATFCTQCGTRIQAEGAAAPTRCCSSYNRTPDLLVLLADILVVLGFFLPWIGVELTSPLNMFVSRGIAWWMWLIPIVLTFGTVVDFFVTLVRVATGKPDKSWRRWNPITSGFGLAIIGVLWWVLLLNVPVFPSPNGYLPLSYMLLQGTTIGMGIGLVLLFVAAILKFTAGVLAVALPESHSNIP